MPRFKVRAEGEPVRFTDQVMFESVKMPSRYLSYSPGTFHSGYNAGTHEVVLSIRSSAFMIMYSYSIDKKKTNFLKGGDVVYLLHKELDSYLAAEGLFTEKSIIEKIHLRSRPTEEFQFTESPSTDSATFFQVEIEDNVTSGDPLEWQTNVRLRHMISRKYLQVNEDRLSLTKTKNKQTVFKFSPIVRITDNIPYDTNVKLEHPLSENFVHGEGINFISFIGLSRPQSSRET